jgi:hypothetical protein
MTQLWPTGQPITMTVDNDGAPIHFVWQEQRHLVHQVIQRWELDLEWWRMEGRIWRDYLALITADNLLCVIYYDRLGEQWLLVRVYD